MWILPSLGRPERAQEVAEAAQDVPINLRLHWGDPRLEDYMKVKWPKAWSVVTSERLSLCETLNWCLKDYPRGKNADFYGFLADDTIPSPSDWADELEHYAGRWNIAYPDDGVHGKDLCTHFCIGGDLVREVGWLALPGLKHSYVDTVWSVIGANLGLLRYKPRVKFNHAHPINKKAEQDATYRVGQSFWEHDTEVFKGWMAKDAVKTINKLRKSMGIV
jgi:hypothetical protein